MLRASAQATKSIGLGEGEDALRRLGVDPLEGVAGHEAVKVRLGQGLQARRAGEDGPVAHAGDDPDVALGGGGAKRHRRAAIWTSSVAIRSSRLFTCSANSWLALTSTGTSSE